MKRELHGYESFRAYKQGYDDWASKRFESAIDQQAYDRGLNDAMLDQHEKAEAKRTHR